MDPSAHWKELNRKYYKFHQFNTITGEQKSLDFFYQRIAVSKWGGPLAATVNFLSLPNFPNIYINYIEINCTKNYNQVILMRTDDLLKDSIVFFSNNGKIISKAQYKEIDRIALFDFLEDEQLLLLKANGSYYIVDPFKGTKKTYDLMDQFKQQQILKGLIVNNGFVLMTTNFEFFYIPNAYEPQVHKMKPSNLTQEPENWQVIPPQKTQSGKVELLIANPDGGIIHIIEDEKWKIYYNKDKIVNEIDKKLPDLRNIKMISLSSNYKNLALLQYINQRWVVTFISDFFDSTDCKQIPIDLKEEDVKKEESAEKDISKIERPRRMLWCGDDCVALQLQQYLVLVSQDSYIKVKMSNPHFALKQEVDGIRILTQKKNEILRKLPEAYVNVFLPLSIKPGAQLHSAYESFEQKNPIEDDELRSKKTELGEAVNDCIKSGYNNLELLLNILYINFISLVQFEINPEYQMKLLKAASYGKTFLGNQLIDPNLLNETCKYLRVSNALRRNGSVGGRVVTYEQVLQLIKNPDLFITLMLRYNLQLDSKFTQVCKFILKISRKIIVVNIHYLAIEISRFLKFQIKQKSTIYTHWACCKVDSQMDDDQLCQIIKEKIKEEKGVSFTQIAQKSIEIGKSQLALKLLDNEQSLSKRIPVLIWMANYQQGNNNSYYEKALIDAIASKDSNLIYLVIMKFLKTDMDETYKFGILSQNPVAQAHLIYYLRNFDDKYLQKYLQYLKKYDECGLLAINQAYQQSNLGEKIRFLEFAQKYFEEESKDSFYSKILQEQIRTLTDLKQEVEREKKEKNKAIMEERPLNSIMEAFLSKDNIQLAQDFAKTYKIPERRFNITRVKALINNKNWEELERFINEKNKKNVSIPYELVADMLIKADQEERGLQMIMKMPDPEESCYMLLKIGQQRHAVQVAINNKKSQLIQDIRGSINDNQARAQLEMYLSQNQK